MNYPHLRFAARIAEQVYREGAPLNNSINDKTARDDMWRRYHGDEWAAYDALPEPIRKRLQEHSYDPWAVNALIVWKKSRQKTGSSLRATITFLRFLDECEDLERAAFAQRYYQRYGLILPHDAAQVSSLRASRV